MNQTFAILLICGLTWTASMAQDEPEPREQGDAPSRPPRMRMGEGERGPGEFGMRGGFRYLIRELDLDEEQQQIFDEITTGQREGMEDMRARWQEIREARRAGDDERAEDLRRDMGGFGDPESRMSEILEALEPHLRDDQVSKLWELQDEIGQRRVQRERFRWVMADLPEELGLNVVQKAHYDKLLENSRREMRERMQELRPSMEALREAVAAGDEEKIRELRQLVDDARPSRTEIVDIVLERLPEVLNEEQKEMLTAMQAEWTGSGGDKQADKSGDAREVLRAAKRVRMEGDQRDKYGDIERETIAAYRKIARKDKEAHAKLADDVKNELANMMNEEQIAQFEKALEQLDRRTRESSKRERKP